jgi:hypothetical protein
VEQAPQTTIFEPAKRQVRISMRTVTVEQSELPALIAEQNEILTELTNSFSSRLSICLTPAR